MEKIKFPNMYILCKSQEQRFGLLKFLYEHDYFFHGDEEENPNAETADDNYPFDEYPILYIDTFEKYIEGQIQSLNSREDEKLSDLITVCETVKRTDIYERDPTW